MSLHILNDSLRRVILVDQYESLIWTERFSDWGDFELVISSNSENRARFLPGTWLGITESHRVMIVETVSDSQDSDGKVLLTITGRSLESLLESRVARNTWADTETNPVWSLTGIPGDIARAIFWSTCSIYPLDPADVIPYLKEGTFFPLDTLQEPTTEVTVDVEPTTVYSAIKEICDTYDLGFRLVRRDGGAELYFNVYAGNDKTSSQVSTESVIFSQSLDNLESVNELNSFVQFKNVAYVFSKAGSLMVYDQGAGPTTTGFQRKVVLVKADDVTPQYVIDSGLELNVILKARGEEELAKNRKTLVFDGEISEYGRYKYGEQYIVGDLVEIRNSDRVTKIVRVSEQIFVFDKEGARSYPTFVDVLYIAPGTWRSWDANMVWQDAPGYWADASPDAPTAPTYVVGTWSEWNADEDWEDTELEWTNASDIV